MIGTKLYKGQFTNKEYADLACWCNANNATIEEHEDYYEVVALPEPSLEELKTAKLAELKNTRDSLEIEPITYNGNNFDYDEKARDRINAAIIALDLAGADAQLSWTTADNTEAIVTANDLRGIIASVALRSNELHIRYRELKALVENALTKEELDAIVW